MKPIIFRLISIVYGPVSDSESDGTKFERVLYKIGLSCRQNRRVQVRIISVQGPIFYGNSNQTESAQKVVLDVQKALNLIARRTVVPEDGIFDKQTVDQLRLFQASHRIVATGAINNDTIERLNRQLAFLVDEAEW